MQVSWIDADEVRDLVALLAEPAARSDSGTPDLETLPEAGDRYGFAVLTEKLAPVPAAPVPAAPVPPPPVPPRPVAAPRVAAPPVPMAPAAASSDVEAAILPDVNLIREKLRAIRDRAQEAGLLPKETPAERAARAATANPPAPAPPAQAPAPPPQTPAAPVYHAPDAGSHFAPTPTVLERLDEFARWCANVTSSEEMFMLDAQGDLLWGSPSSADYLICAKLAMTAGMRPHAAPHAPPASTTNVQVGPGKELQLLSCPATHGNVTIALVNARQIPISSLRQGFSLAMGG